MTLSPKNRSPCATALIISSTKDILLTYGEFKSHRPGSNRQVHHGDFKQGCEKQKILLLSKKTLKTKMTQHIQVNSKKKSVTEVKTYYRKLKVFCL